ncbi:hypothetical protein [Streptomyces bobili]|uniref:hypothetical protein n=1 Tax=Streptomyces bobili TaxID=67280 RepID=UPI001302D1DC|nr:hypothetical protein [Streptomyces bobili]
MPWSGLLLGLLAAVLSLSLGLLVARLGVLHQLVDVVLGAVVGELRLKGLAA